MSVATDDRNPSNYNTIIIRGTHALRNATTPSLSISIPYQKTNVD